MKNLNKKIGSMVLVGIMAVGGLAVSGIKADASSLGSGINGVIDQGGYLRRSIFSAFHEYNESHKDKVDFIDFYSNNNNKYKDAKLYKFDFYDIDDFLDYIDKNYEGKNKKGAGAYKVRLEKEKAVIVVHFR